MKKKITLLILIIITIIIVVVCLLLLKKDNKLENKEYNNEYKIKINELLNYDNKIKKIFYSKPNIDLEANILSDKNTYYLLKDNLGFNSIDEIYDKISNIYSINYKKTFLNDINNYNSLLMINNNIYINIKSKCIISDYEDDIKIVNINEDEGIVEYKYNENNYKMIFKKDKNLYLLDNSPFECN